MIRKGLILLFMLLLSAVGAGAQEGTGGEVLPAGYTCETLKKDCESIPEEEAEVIFDAADLGAMGGRPIVGTCYVHTKSTCPNCACWSYVKLSYMGGQNGWDGGTGCIQPMGSTEEDKRQSRKNAALLLRQLCISGACCCPQVETKTCPNPTPVKARDPITGSCCNFPNSCSAPENWDIVPQGQPCPAA